MGGRKSGELNLLKGALAAGRYWPDLTAETALALSVLTATMTAVQVPQCDIGSQLSDDSVGSCSQQSTSFTAPCRAWEVFWASHISDSDACNGCATDSTKMARKIYFITASYTFGVTDSMAGLILKSSQVYNFFSPGIPPDVICYYDFENQAIIQNPAPGSAALTIPVCSTRFFLEG